MLFTSLVFFAAAMAAFGQDDQKPGKLLISGGMTLGALTGGGQLDALRAHKSAYSSAGSDGVLYLDTEADLRYFPLRFWGVELNGALGSSTTDFTTDSYPAGFSTNVVSLGMIVRTTASLEENLYADLFVGAGVNNHSFSYGSSYSTTVALPSVTPEPGFYAKAGATLYFGRPFFLVGEVDYQRLRDQIAATNQSFDAELVTVTARAGMDF